MSPADVESNPSTGCRSAYQRASLLRIFRLTSLCEVVVVVAALALAALTSRAANVVTIEAANRLVPDAPAWRELAAGFAQQPDTLTDFEEQRFFPFRNDPVVFKGEVRVSRTRGLSLRYTAPSERVMILDERGVLARDASGEQAPPDARAAAANRALLNVLRMDFAGLEKEFEVYGRRDAAVWSIALVPRDEALRRAIGNIFVTGEATAVRTIELRRSAKQRIDITIAPPRATTAFGADDVKKYFR